MDVFIPGEIFGDTNSFMVMVVNVLYIESPSVQLKCFTVFAYVTLITIKTFLALKVHLSVLFLFH